MLFACQRYTNTTVITPSHNLNLFFRAVFVSWAVGVYLSSVDPAVLSYPALRLRGIELIEMSCW
jgi:ABC-type branched-subunit amino acid transport system permease subunit